MHTSDDRIGNDRGHHHRLGCCLPLIYTSFTCLIYACFTPAVHPQVCPVCVGLWVINVALAALAA